VDGLQEGRGTYSSPDGERYVGDWLGGVEYGNGTKEYPDGTVYKGEFKNSMRDGRGVLIIPGQGERKGLWKNDKEIDSNNIQENNKFNGSGEMYRDFKQPVVEHFSSPKPDYKRTDDYFEEVPGGTIYIQRLSPQRSITPVINNDE